MCRFFLVTVLILLVFGIAIVITAMIGVRYAYEPARDKVISRIRHNPEEFS